MRTREAQCSCCYTAGSDGWFSVQFFPGAVEHTGMQRPIRHAPPRVPAGCISLRAGLLLAVGPLETVAPSGPDFSLPRAQRGGVAERRAAGCGLSPRPRHDRRVSRPAAGVLRQGTRPAARRGVREASGGARDSRVEEGAGGGATGKVVLYFLYSFQTARSTWNSTTVSALYQLLAAMAKSQSIPLVWSMASES
jgi:hypothetical protein